MPGLASPQVCTLVRAQSWRPAEDRSRGRGESSVVRVDCGDTSVTCRTSQYYLVLEVTARAGNKVCTITEKAPTSAFTFKTLSSSSQH